MVLHAAATEWLTSPPTLPTDAIVVFYADIDPKTGEMWCPDCRRVKSTIDWLFNGDDKPPAYVIYVGSKADIKPHLNCNTKILSDVNVNVTNGSSRRWKLPAHNHFRSDYKIDSIPTMVKFKGGKEVCRLVEDEILDTHSLARLFEA